jgi:hypothetical protein
MEAILKVYGRDPEGARLAIIFQEHDAALAEEPTTLVEADGIRIVSNKPADRVQIFFPGKPNEEMRGELKGEG